MENLVPKESLLFITIALVGYGVKIIETNFIYGLIAFILGAGCLIGRAYLKKQGFDIAGKK